MINIVIKFREYIYYYYYYFIGYDIFDRRSKNEHNDNTHYADHYKNRVKKMSKTYDMASICFFLFSHREQI